MRSPRRRSATRRATSGADEGSRRPARRRRGCRADGSLEPEGRAIFLYDLNSDDSSSEDDPDEAPPPVAAAASAAEAAAAAPGTLQAARKRPAEQAPAAAAGSSKAAKQARVAIPPAREGLVQQARIKAVLGNIASHDLCGIIGEANALLGVVDDAAGRPLPEQVATLLQLLGV